MKSGLFERRRSLVSNATSSLFLDRRSTLVSTLGADTVVFHNGGVTADPLADEFFIFLGIGK